MYQLLSQVISLEPNNLAPTINPQNFPSLLIYGGVAVAVIIALTYYNQVLLKLIIKLVSANRQNK